MKFITTGNMKELERLTAESGVGYYGMMERAGQGAAKRIASRWAADGKRVTVLCGRGNNAGDGLVCARELAACGAVVTVCFTQGEMKTEDARRALANLNARSDITYLSGISEAAVQNCDILVDAVFGTGFHGEPAPEMADLFALANACGAKKAALDIPSGVEADTGRFSSCIRADLCIAFAGPKPAHLVNWATQYAAETVYQEIGAPPEVLRAFPGFCEAVDDRMAASLLPLRRPTDHKGSHGRLLLVAGSRRFPGAACLAASASLRTGVGYTQLASTEFVCGTVAQRNYETIYAPCEATPEGGVSAKAVPAILEAARKSDAVAAGCGLTDCPDTREIILALLRECECPLILDADGLNVLRGDLEPLRQAKAPVLLTPHPGEFSRLTGMNMVDIENSRYDLGETEIGRLNSIALLLKGPVTAIHSAAGDRFSFRGTEGLAKGGSGDVLTGVIGGLAAAGLPLADAAALGAYLHGSAAEKAAAMFTPRAMLPSSIPAYIPGVYRWLSTRAGA